MITILKNIKSHKSKSIAQKAILRQWNTNGGPSLCGISNEVFFTPHNMGIRSKSVSYNTLSVKTKTIVKIHGFILKKRENIHRHAGQELQL